MNFQSKDSFESLIQIQPYSETWRQNISSECTFLENVINKSFNNLMPQCLMDGSSSALKFTITKHFLLLLIKYLNHHAELILTEKN